MECAIDNFVDELLVELKSKNSKNEVVLKLISELETIKVDAEVPFAGATASMEDDMAITEGMAMSDKEYDQAKAYTDKYIKLLGLKVEDGENSSYGSNGDNKLIILKRRDDEKEEMAVLLHEVEHAVTLKMINDNKDSKDMQKLMDDVESIIMENYDKLSENTLDRLNYASSRKSNTLKTAEAIAILSTEKTVRDEVLKLTSKKKAAWIETILDVVRKLLDNPELFIQNDMIKIVDELVKASQEQEELVEDVTKLGVGDSAEQTYQRMQQEKTTKLEDKITKQMGGTIRIFKNQDDKRGKNYDIESLRVNIDAQSVTIKMSKGKDFKTYTFDFGGKGRSNKTATGKVVMASWLNDYIKDLGPVLKSQDDVEFDFSSFDSLENEVHGNVEGMQNLLDELHLAGGEKETDSHLAYLRGLIGEMNQSFFEKMNTFIDNTSIKSGGIITGTKIGLKVSKGAKLVQNQMSEAEIYAHELVHAMSMFALADKENKDSRKLRKELEYVMNVAMDNLTWEDFMPEVSIDKDAEEKIAKDMFEYIFNSSKAEEEFIAHVLTNPIIMDKMKNINLKEQKVDLTIFEKILDMFAKLMDMLRGDYKFSEKNNSLYEQTKLLTFKLGEINKKSVRNAKDNETLGKKIWNTMQNYNSGSGEMLENFYQKNIVGKIKYEDKPPKGAGLLAKSKWIAKTVTMFIINDEYNKAFELLLSAYGLKPEGTLQSIIRDFKKPDDFANEVDMLALQADKIDQAKLTLITAEHESITESFSRRLETNEESALTRVILDTDLSSIYDKYTTRQIRKMLEDEDELYKFIGRAKHRMKKIDEKNYNWNMNQSEGLGYYMATNKGHIAQNLNAETIARGYQSSERRGDPSKELIDIIDEVATLTALRFTSRTNKAIVRELMRSETDGIKTIINKHNYFKKESRKHLFDGASTLMIKGYSREIFDDKISMIIAPTSEEIELSKQGYTLKKVLSKSVYDSNKTPVAIYIADAFEINEWYRTATRLTSLGSKGTTLDEVRYKTDGRDGRVKAEMDKLRIDEHRMKIIKEMENGTFDRKNAEYGMLPVMDNDGIVINYRYVMDKESKEEFLGQNTEVGEVLSRSFGHTLDKSQTSVQNKKVLDLLLSDMKTNYNGTLYGNNNKEYIVISENSTNKEIKELYKVLPSSFKHAIYESEGKKLAVRRDMLHNFFGYRHLSILDFPLLRKITPAIMQRLIKIVETMWIEFIKITKANILIKMPVVIIGNIISNFMYSVMTGTNPFELLGMYVDSTRDVRAYLKKHRELIDLEIAKNSGNLQKKDLRKMDKLKRELENNPGHELVELGIYQAIVEDISRSETAHSNKLKQLLNEKTANAPKMIKDGANWLYLTEETGYYKFMSEVLQMSDLVARDIENRKLKKIQEKQTNGDMHLPRWFVTKGKSKDYEYKKEKRVLRGKEREEFNTEATKIRHLAILNAFINYNKPSSNVEEYLNRVGAIMFTKYAKRIQRVIGETFTKNPMNALLLIMGESFTGDVETIYDQSFLNRSWYNLGLSGGDMVPFTSPFERLMDALNPPAVALLTESRVWH